MPLNQEQLDYMTCGCGGNGCNNNFLYLHGRCHISAPSWVRYEHGTGIVEVLCAECGELVAKIAVAKKEG